MRKLTLTVVLFALLLAAPIANAQAVDEAAVSEAISAFQQATRRENDPMKIVAALEEIAKFPHKDIIRAVKDFLVHDDDEVSRAAARALRDVPESAEVYREAVRALPRIVQRGRAIDELVDLLDKTGSLENLIELAAGRSLRDNYATREVVLKIAARGNLAPADDRDRAPEQARVWIVEAFIRDAFREKPSVMIALCESIAKWSDKLDARIREPLAQKATGYITSHRNPYVKNACIAWMGEWKNDRSYRAIMDGLMPPEIVSGGGPDESHSAQVDSGAGRERQDTEAARQQTEAQSAQSRAAADADAASRADSAESDADRRTRELQQAAAAADRQREAGSSGSANSAAQGEGREAFPPNGAPGRSGDVKPIDEPARDLDPIAVTFRTAYDALTAIAGRRIRDYDRAEAWYNENKDTRQLSY
ncbi:MAG: hypothetical protein NUW37_07340 [Planctomycetes bacterium]|nr:hypothetical protein [Planctomycetota bacterium]